MSKIKENAAGIFLSAAACFMLLCYAPVEIFASNSDDFAFNAIDIIKIMLPLSIAAFIICSLVFQLFLKLFGRKAYNILSILCFVALIATYVQGTFLSADVPVLDGETIYWEQFSRQNITSIIMWILLGAGCAAGVRALGCAKVMRTISAASAFLLAMLVVSFGLLCIQCSSVRHSNGIIVSEDGMFTFSKENPNFTILMLDAVTAKDFSNLSESHPEYKEYYEDFTYFPNTVGAYSFTKRSVPLILTGKWHENEEPFEEYNKKAFSASPLFEKLEQEGYKISLFDNDAVPLTEESIARFENVKEPDSRNFAYPGRFIKMQLSFSGLKYLPYFLKQYAVLSTDDIWFDSQWDTPYEQFNYENYSFYHKMLKAEITICPDSRFNFIHIAGAHVPFYSDAQMNDIEDATYEQAVEASMYMAGIYINKLRECSAYDNSIIIIMADHGSGDFRHNPVLIVKGINEKHEYRVSEVPISYDDLQDAFLKLIDGSESEAAFPSDAGGVRSRRFIKYSHGNAGHEGMTEMIHQGYATDPDALTPTGVIFPEMN